MVAPYAPAPAASTTRAISVVHVVLGLNTGGLERLVLRLLARLDRARFTPTVVALDEPGVLAPELARLGVPLHVLDRRPGLDAGLALRLSTLLLREGARLVHTHNASPHLYGSLAAQFARARSRSRYPRVVHTKHGRNEPEAARKVMVNRVASALSDRVVTVSSDAASVAIHVERVRPDKVMTIWNGVDTDEFRPRADGLAARAALGAPREGFHVGCVARLAAVKDHRTLLAAFASFRERRRDAHLTLIGDGPERAALEAHALDLGLWRAVTFAGERADVAPLYSAFDAFALSSLSEGISLTLLEAASAGLPIVATRVGGNPEVVVDGVTGILVPPGDPASFAEALAAVSSRWDRAAMGAAGRARVVSRFGLDRMAREYEELYTSVLGNG
jgi:sugar transferase (PEP-CTERM/EpsH1 system associated)